MTTFTFNKFEGIAHIPLRVYNRTVFMNNLMSDFGADKVQEYINLFSEPERKQMYLMATAIRQLGVERVKRAVTSDMPLEEASNG